MKLLFAILVIITIILAFTVFALAIQYSPYFYFGLTVLPLLIFSCYKIHKNITAKRMLEKLRREWGKENIRERNFDEIEKLFIYSTSSPEKDTLIDDHTWADLNMDEIYSNIDRTLTNPGECVLYNVLRTPLLSDTTLKKRSEVVRLFQRNQDIRENVQLNLCGLGKQKYNGITSLVWHELPPSTFFKYLFSILAFIALVSIFVIPLLGATKTVFVIIAPVFAINSIITITARKRLFSHLGAIRYLGTMIRVGKKISEIDCPELMQYCEILREATTVTEKIAQKTLMLLPEKSFAGDIPGVVYEYINIFFLNEVRIFYAVIDQIREHKDELKSIYSLIGELDSLQSVASHREGLPSYVEPEFTSKNKNLMIKEMWHPLLEEPVRNSIDIREKGVIVTGSNMSGKTTFLRTLGVNSILAQTIYTCLARSYVGNYFRIFSSVNEVDNLMEGKSYYLVEAERLLKMIRS